MAWTTPRTWTNGETVTKTIMDTHVRDNFNAVCTAAFTTKGDGFFATGANAGARVPVSSSNGGIMVQNSACNAGVMFDGRFQIAASIPKITSSCLAQLQIISTNANNKAAQLNFYDNATAQYQVGVDLSSNGNKNFFIYDTPDATARMIITASGQVLIGTSTCNSKHTDGLTVSSASSLNGVPGFSIQDGTIAHGITGVADAATMGFMSSWNACGGLRIGGITGCEIGLVLTGYVTTISAVRSTAATAPVRIEGLEKTGAGGASTMAVNRNVAIVSDGGNTRFIFDSEGDFHADAAVTASSFDAYNDAHMVRALELARNPGGVIRTEFDGWLKHNRADLEQAKIATFNDGPGGDGSVFVNVTGLQRLHSGAIWQLYTELQAVKSKLAALSPPTDRQELESTWEPPLLHN